MTAIVRATPLAPIPLWEADGHILPEPWRRAPVTPTDPRPLAEGDPLPNLGHPIGEHALCGGVFMWRQVSAKYRVIVCKMCGARFSVTNDVVTWGQLREFCVRTYTPSAP